MLSPLHVSTGLRLGDLSVSDEGKHWGRMCFSFERSPEGTLWVIFFSLSENIYTGHIYILPHTFCSLLISVEAGRVLVTDCRASYSRPWILTMGDGNSCQPLDKNQENNASVAFLYPYGLDLSLMVSRANCTVATRFYFFICQTALASEHLCSL